MNEKEKVKKIQKGLEKVKEFRKSSGPISGVCGGIADYIGIPPLVVRIATIIAVIELFEFIIPAYILLVIFMPKANKDYLRNYTENNRQTVSRINSNIQCENCGEVNNAERNYCQKCSNALY